MPPLHAAAAAAASTVPRGILGPGSGCTHRPQITCMVQEGSRDRARPLASSSRKSSYNSNRKGCEKQQSRYNHYCIWLTKWTSYLPAPCARARRWRIDVIRPDRQPTWLLAYTFPAPWWIHVIRPDRQPPRAASLHLPSTVVVQTLAQRPVLQSRAVVVRRPQPEGLGGGILWTATAFPAPRRCRPDPLGS